MRRLWTFVRPYRGIFWGALLLSPVNQVFSLVQPYLLKLGIDRYVSRGDVPGLGRLALVYLAAIVGELASAYGQQVLTMVVAQRSLGDLRVRMFRHLQGLPMTFFDRTPVGRLVSRVTTDVDVLNEMFAAGAMTIVLDGLKLVSMVRSSGAHQGTPIVIITTEGAEADRRRAMALGASAYLVKPVQAQQVVDSVRTLLRLD